ncbi:MAG: tetratricopeptide repeat protein [Verrucomicrobia bacterium]|nr:tetratricopeptide repeat protein [Verrucomicrobiota bacterium]
MGKKKRGNRHLQTTTPEAVRASAAAQTVAHCGKASGSTGIPIWKLWLFRLTLVLLLPWLILVAIESGLRLSGYGYPTSFFLKLDDGRFFTSNRKFAWQYYPRETATQPFPIFVPALKLPGTRRIFVLGESAAAGTPDPAFGFARVLEVMLRRQYPEQRLEVINAAMRGINSHIILPIARECARLQPDLFIIYMGNNEAIGLHAPEPKGISLTAYPRLLRLGQWVKSTRLAQLIEAGIRAVQKPGASKSQGQDAEYFRRHRLLADHPRRRPVYDNFRANLEAMVRTILDSHAKAIVSTVAVNLKDFPPLGSLSRADLTEAERTRWEAAYAAGMAAESSGQFKIAIQQYAEALRVDDRFADLHFRLARCHAALGQADQAREHYRLARDWDAMQFRADSRQNEIVRQIASGREREGIYAADAERAFGESPLSDRGTPGGKLFNDHVHFTFEGDYLLAGTLLGALTNALELGVPAAPLPSPRECADLIAFTAWDEFNVAEAMARMTAKPPFTDQLEHAERQRLAEMSITNKLRGFRREDLDRAVQTYRQAIAQNTNDWQLQFNFGGLLSDMKDYAAAISQYQIVLRLHPSLLQVRMALGDVLMKVGRFDEAVQQFTEALQIDPEYRPARSALEQAKVQGARR